VRTTPERLADLTVLQQAAEALRTAGPRWMLVVDDAHLLDRVSATLVHHLTAEQSVRWS
jgi:hypothetical protein